VNDKHCQALISRQLVTSLLLRATSHTSQEVWPCDHEIVRAQKKVSKGHPKHLQNHVVYALWSHTWPGPGPNALSMNVYSCEFSNVIKYNKLMVVSVRSAMISRFCVRLATKRWFFKNMPSDHETWPIRCHVGIHVDFISILHLDTLGRFRLWPNFERRSVWTNENAKMPKVRPLGLHTRGRSPKDVASKRA